MSVRALGFVAVIAGMLAAGLPWTAHAGGNVLVPEDEGDSGSDSLGLTPGQSGAPATKSNSSSSPGADESDLLPAPSPSNKNYTPMPSQVSTGTGAASGATFIQFPSPAQDASLDLSASDLPLLMRFDIADKSTLAFTDNYVINHTLGIPTSEIAAHCHLSSSGTLSTGQNTYPFDTGPSSTHADMRYEGNPTNAIVMVQAICDEAPQPKGYVFTIGNQYSVSLGMITCPAPPHNAKDLIFEYQGSSRGQCTYK
jgi:hypothetical protein